VPSRRLPSDLKPNTLARARAFHRVDYDLTVTNPTACSLPYGPELLSDLARAESLAYRPDPKGLLSAREAIAAVYAARGVTVDPDRIVLAASSSEAYGFLFKLLCDPGDGVLVPTPSYPLFEHLAALEGVRALAYALDPDHGWQPQSPAPELAAAARAAILVHPNNPTGSWVSREAAEGVAGRSLPLIVDEVFLDFPLDPVVTPPTFASRTTGLTFTLGGLSKSCGLPQLKLSWIVVSGPDREVTDGLERLEFIADTYLSVGTPVQVALPSILERARPLRDAIRARCAGNLAAAQRLAASAPSVSVPVPGGGWSLVIRFPKVITEDALVVRLLEERGVAIHPGYFFDFPTDGYLVASLLPEPATFEEGFGRVLALCEQESERFR
jgi:aspartate/methionine/tyrosine aminotransferase